MFERPVYIHLSRHPLAMIKSFVDHHMEQAYFYHDAFTARQAAEIVWTITHRNILTFLRDVPADRHVHVCYEDLVAQPLATMRTVSQAIGLDFHPDLLEPYKDKDRKIPAGVHPESRSMGDPAFHTFRTITTERAVAPDDDTLGDPARALAGELGYELPGRRAAADGAVAATAPEAARARHVRDALQQQRRRRAAGPIATS